jgi:ribosome biogenesis GTPase
LALLRFVGYKMSLGEERRMTARRPASPAGESGRDDGSRRTPPPGAVWGIVVRAFGKFFAVQLPEGSELLSTVTGSLKRRRRGTDLVAVGDRVLVTDVGEGEGRIHAVAPRERALSRLARHTDDVEQVILANPDQVLFLFAVRDPEPHPRLLDRFLIMAESRDLPALIGVNKIDLDTATPDSTPALAHRIFNAYEPLYPVFSMSAKTGEGLEEVRHALRGRITAVAGPSGVGKSSLLNALDPGRERAVGEISAATGKGRHTTTATVLHRLPGDEATYVADTPGIRALALQGVDLEDLDYYFPEMRPFLGSCRFPDCAHLTEPDCAVRSAVEVGEISGDRYASYVSLRQGRDDDV